MKKTPDELIAEVRAALERKFGGREPFSYRNGWYMRERTLRAMRRKHVEALIDWLAGRITREEARKRAGLDK